MSFSNGQSIPCPSFVMPKVDKVTRSPSGILERVRVDANQDLPDGEMFNLENMVKAGVNLEEVSSVLFKKNAIPVPNVEEKPENKEENK